MEACTFPGCVFQILSVVSPVEGQERRICHYQLGSAKQLGWRGAVKSQEVGNLTQSFRDAGKVRGGGQPDLTSDLWRGPWLVGRVGEGRDPLTQDGSCRLTTVTTPPPGVAADVVS